VTITNEMRNFGADSFIAQGKNLPNTFKDLSIFLGIEYSAENVEKLEKEGFVFSTMAKDERGLIGFTVKKDSTESAEEEIFYTEELLAMILGYGRKLAETLSEGYVRDTVITVPSYFDQTQRRMVEEAADLAGLTTLQLLHENTAAATMFGIDRMDTEKPLTILFYNMGNKDTEVSIVRYSAVSDLKNKTFEHIEVIGEGYDAKLGS
jgi:molecular chaperone DnaK (HSP70)